MAGTFGYEPNQSTFFGINRGIEAYGAFMNVRTAQVVKDRAGNSDNAMQLNLQVGMLSSALESGIPEQMFTDPNTGIMPQGFSTATALAMAMQQGQKIYIITQQNKATTLPALHLDSLAMSDINNALATGKEIVTHTDKLTIPGFAGSGYAIIDPTTGDGIYKISGGKNGGFILLLAGALLFLLIYMEIASGAAMLSPALLAASFILALSFVVAGIALINGDKQLCTKAMSTGLTVLTIMARLSFNTNKVAGVVLSSVIMTQLMNSIGDAVCQV